MIGLPLAVMSAPLPAVRVERSRDTLPSAWTRVSTSLDTNGKRSEQTAIDAERAFAADAKTLGQWTAFRKWSTDDALMFDPQPVKAHDFLKDRKDPLKAIDWWPTASYISCDGETAVNTGGWRRPDGKVGYFTTVWERQEGGGWKWIVDSGGDLKVARPRPAKPRVRMAKCVDGMTSIAYVMRVPGAKIGSGRGGGGSLQYWWSVMPDGKRTFVVGLYDGKSLATVIDDKIAPPK